MSWSKTRWRSRGVIWFLYVLAFVLLFVDVRPRLSRSVCRLNNPSSEICGSGFAISDVLRMPRLGLRALVYPGVVLVLGVEWPVWIR